MNKAYLISTATALALGYAAGFASDGIIAKAEHAQTRSHIVAYTFGAGAAATLEGYLTGWLCNKIVEEFDITPGECTVALFKPRGVTIVWEPPAGAPNGSPAQWQIKSLVEIAGTWVPGAPQ